MRRKIVFLEANEIPYRVLDDFVEQNPDGSFARLLRRCRQYTTVAADTCPLSPWITWPTLHRGVNNEKHGVLHFGQDLDEVDRLYPPIWKLLVEGGVKTGVFGPLHSWPLPDDFERYAFFLPDTFAKTSESHPAELTHFQNFNLVMARQSPRNVSTSIDLRSLSRLLLWAPALGIRPKTLASVARQLLDERRHPWKKTRRRTYQPVLAFDLFMKQLERHQPEFSNFFTNHVASAMHRYWAARYPGEYDDLELGPDWQQRYAGEIGFAMRWLEDMFGRVARFADRHPEFLVVLATSMGQAATSGERVESQLYLRHPAKLMARAGIADSDWSQRAAMDPTVSLYVAEPSAQRLERFLASLEIQGEPVRFSTEDGGFLDLCFGHVGLDPQRDVARLDGQPIAFSELGLEVVAVEDEAGSTAYHVPEGVLLVYDPIAVSVETGRPEILTTDVAPALLAHFGLDVPDYMRAPGALRLQ